jgi:hypothetical protein
MLLHGDAPFPAILNRLPYQGEMSGHVSVAALWQTKSAACGPATATSGHGMSLADPERSASGDQ